jgi:integrase
MLGKRGILVVAVARLQFFHGLRISEVLSITGNDIDRFGGIIIRGKKGSSPRKVIDSELHTFWVSKRLLCSEKVFEFDRFFIYRLYKSVGINHAVEGKMNNAVTHFPRHVYIKEVQSSLNDVEKTALVVGHKSSNSTKGYLKSKIK